MSFQQLLLYLKEKFRRTFLQERGSRKTYQRLSERKKRKEGRALSLLTNKKRDVPGLLYREKEGDGLGECDAREKAKCL